MTEAIVDAGHNHMYYSDDDVINLKRTAAKFESLGREEQDLDKKAHTDAQRKEVRKKYGEQRHAIIRSMLPVYFDIRHLLKPIRDQGTCGSCWSFAFIAAVEGALARRAVEYSPLSEQFILDCAWGHGSHACDGGDAGAYEMLGIGIPEASDYGGYLS